MAEGVSTRLQKEFSQLQKELERMELKFDGGIAQLRGDVERLGSEMRKMFETVMSKMEAMSPPTNALHSAPMASKAVEGWSMSKAEMQSADSGETHQQRLRRHERLECPRFDGDQLSGWLKKLEQYFASEQVPEEAKIKVVMMHLEGRALQWHQYFSRSQGGIENLQWPVYLRELRARFGNMEFSDPMSELISLKHSTSVDDYYDEFLTILDSLQLSPDYALSIFISNLHPEISKTVRLFSPKTLKHAYNLAKQLESLNVSDLRQPFFFFNPSGFI